MKPAIDTVGEQTETIRPRGGSWSPLLAAFLLVAAFYGWTTRSNGLDWHFGAEQHDPYNLLVHGFLSGQLSLMTDVPGALRRAPNPYDPALRPPGVAIHDASLYRGRYYIYYGVVPAVVALAPFRLLTGVDLPIPAAVLGFALASLATALAILGVLRGRYFPHLGPGLTFALGIAVAFAGMGPLLVRRSNIYELPITCASWFALLALGSLLGAFIQPRRRLAWVAAGSLAWALAIGSRPTYLLAPIGWLIVVGWQFRAGVGGRRWAPLAAAAVGPLAVVGLLLGWYNFARFGNPMEFGVSYILSGVYEAKIEHFRLRYVPWNLFAYFLAPAEWGRFFPFFHPLPIPWARPAQHFGMDLPFGLLVNVPFIWLGVVALPRIRAARGSDELAAFTGALVWAGVAVVMMIVSFYAAMARYLGDFAPIFALLGAIGGMAWLEHTATSGSAGRRAAARAAIVVLAAISVGSVFAVSVAAYNRFRTLNPAAYARVARRADAPIFWLERLTGSIRGPIALDLMLPGRRPAGAREELVRTGWNSALDRIWIDYPDDRHVAFAFEHGGADPVVGAPVAVDRTQRHRVRIALGSLFPAPTWPGYAEWTHDETLAAERLLRVELDGKTVLAGYQRFHEATPGTVAIGGDHTAAPFTGTILRVVREPVVRPSAAMIDEVVTLTRAARASRDPQGVFHWRVTFPRVPRAGGREPILVSGETGRGDLVGVEYLGPGRLRWYLDHWGAPGLSSASLGYDPGHEYGVEIEHPVFADGRPPTAPDSGALIVRMDGREVWRVDTTFYPADTDDLFIGNNPIGGSGTARNFSGRIVPAK